MSNDKTINYSLFIIGYSQFTTVTTDNP